MAFDRKGSIKMAAEHNSFSEEQLGTWVEMYHQKGKLSDDDINDLSDKVPKAKAIYEKIQAEKASAAVIIGDAKENIAICKTCGKEFVKTTWNQVYCPECKAAQKK